MDQTETQFDQIREVLHEFPVRLGIVFGSRARGEAVEGSDIDLAIAFDRANMHEQSYSSVFLGLGVRLEEVLDTPVDVLDLRNAPPAIAHHVLQDGRLIIGDEGDLKALIAQLEATERPSRDQFEAVIKRVDDALS